MRVFGGRPSFSLGVFAAATCLLALGGCLAFDKAPDAIDAIESTTKKTARVSLDLLPPGEMHESFVRAHTIFRSACLGCHPSFTRRTESDWIFSGLVQVGDATKSELFRRLAGNGIPGSAADMPEPPTAPLKADAVTSVRAWLDGMDDARITSLTVTREGEIHRITAAITRFPKSVLFEVLNSGGASVETRTLTTAPYEHGFTPAQNGSYSVRVTVRDFGDKVADQSTQTFVVISVPNPATPLTSFPTGGTAVRITSPANGQGVGASVDLSLVCRAGTPVQLSGDIAAVAYVACPTSGSLSILGVALYGADGPKLVRARQIFTNTTRESTVTIQLDRTPPQLMLTEGPEPDAKVTSRMLLLRGRCERDRPITITGSIGAAQTKPCNNEFSFVVELTAGDGTKTLQITQADALGNSATLELRYRLAEAAAAVALHDFQRTCSGAATAEDLELSPVRRLTRVQYVNTMRDLLGSLWTGAQATIADSLATVPDEKVPTGISEYSRFKRAARATNIDHPNGYHLVANGLVDYIFSDTARATSLVGDCYSTSLPTACLRTFITTFGRRVLRRTLTTAQTDALAQLSTDSSSPFEGVKSVTYALLTHPRFVYLVEDANTTMTNGVVALDDYEIAARISYQFWDSTPDAELLTRAQNGTLTTDAGITSAITYLFTNAASLTKLKASTWGFFAEWLGKGYGKSFDNTGRFRALAGGRYLGAEGEELRDQMIDELREMIEYYTFTQASGQLGQLLSTRQSFAKESLLAALYGVPVWNGTSAPPTHTGAGRYGLLTAAGMLASSLDYPNPYRRGGDLYRFTLCGTFTTSAAAAPALSAEDPNNIRTNRQFFESMVPVGTSCMDCHGRTGPVGFAFENYDNLGRYNGGTEISYAKDGTFIAQLNTDSSGSVTLPTGTYVFNDGIELIRQLNSAHAVEACLAKQYFRHAFGRFDTSRDACTVKRLYDVLVSGGIQAMLREIALTKAFRYRRPS